MKKILSIAVISIIVFSMFSMLAPQAYATFVGSSEKGILTKQWRYDMQSLYSTIYFGSSPAIANLLGDSRLEIVTGSDEYYNYYPELGYYASGIWRCFDSQGNLLWAKNTGTDESRSSPVIADINQDGQLEIVGGTTSGWNVEAMDRFGNFIWTFPWPPQPGAPFLWHSSPAVADIDPSISGLEVVIGNNAYGNVWAFDGDNSDGINDGITATDWWIYGGTEGIHWDVLWVFQTGGSVVSSPVLGDIDNDGQIEIVIGSMDGKVYVLNGITGALEWSYQTGGGVASSAAIANLDGDPYLEVVIGSSDGKIYCLQWNGVGGSVEWFFPTAGGVYSSPAIGDIDGDGQYDVVIGSDDGKIYALNSDGSLNWSYSTGGAVRSSAALANRGTAGLGVYIGSYDDYLYLIDGRTGTLIDRFLTYGDIYTSPSVADVDGDGKLEIFFYDATGSLDHYTFWALEDTGSTTSPYSMEWPMFRHDACRTGLYTWIAPPTPPEEWSFAIITDLHIGFGYPDYGPDGFNEREKFDDSAILRLSEDYYLTDRLMRIVESINNNPQIKFVVVLGDISDTAEYSEFLKAREILNGLKVPYIPILGNHDVWPYTQEPSQESLSDIILSYMDPYFTFRWDHFNPDRRRDKEQSAGSACGDTYFNEIFWGEQNAVNVQKIKALFGSWGRQEDKEGYKGPPYIQNYNFTYKGVKFIVLDWNAREIDASLASLLAETKDWLEENLKFAKEENQPVIIFSHHPMISANFTITIEGLEHPLYQKIESFSLSDLDEIDDIIRKSEANVLGCFGGHSHANFIAVPGYKHDVRHTEHISIPTGPGYIPIEFDLIIEGHVVNKLNIDIITEAVNREGIRWLKWVEQRLEDYPKFPLRTETGKCIRTVTILGKELVSYSKLDSVTEDSNLRPTSYFTYWPATEKMSFKKFSAFPYDPDGNPVDCTYAWSFGDGQTASSDRTPWHHYKAGEYTVTLTVTDGGGVNSGPFSRTVIVRKLVEIRLWSPADLIVTDPEGLTLSKDIGEVLGMSYMEFDIYDDGKLEDMVTIWEPKIGDYLITVIPEPDAVPTDTYTLEVWVDGVTTVLAENAQMSNIPTQPYIVRSTETEIIPIIPATVDFDPDTLNLKSKGQWVTVYIELPVGHGYDVSMINLTSVMLNGQVQAEIKPIAIGDYDGDGIPDLMVKFNRTAVQSILNVGDDVEITISGTLIDGRLFEDKDTIQVILPP